MQAMTADAAPAAVVIVGHRPGGAPSSGLCRCDNPTYREPYPFGPHGAARFA